MRHSACGHPSGPAAVAPHQQAGHTTASNDSRRNDQIPLASWGPSTHDRKDARGIAQLLRMGWFRPVHCKSPAGPGGPGAAGRAQAPAGQAAGRRAEHPRHPARLRAEGRRGEQGPVRGAHPRAGRRPADAGAGDRADAAGPRGVARRVSRAAPGGARHRPRGCDLPAADDGAGRRCAGGDHLHLGGRRSGAGSADRARWARTSASRRRSTSPARPT